MQPSFEEVVAIGTQSFSEIFHLRSLTLDAVSNHVSRNQAEANTIFAYLPDLTELCCHDLTPEVASAVAHFCPRLDQFCQLTEWVYLPSVPGGTIYHQCHPKSSRYPIAWSMVNSQGPIFQSCRSLRVFDAIQHKFEAEYVSNVAWVCEGLEVFRCQIVGLYRLSMTGHSVLSYITESGLREEEFSDKERLVLENVRICQYLHEASMTS